MIATLSRSDVATATGLTPPTVSKYIKRRWIRAVLVGRRWRVDAASVEHLLRHGSSALSGTIKTR